MSSPALSEGDLRRGFDAFIEASRRLEESYSALKARAEAVDLQLGETNRVLQRTLAERETVFDALPIGLLALRGDGSLAFTNPEGRRLCGWLRERGRDPAALPAGELAEAGAVVDVRRVPLPDGELVLLEDRSRVAALEQEVRRLDRLAGLSELALGVAHEIKNPLNGVLGFASMLEREPSAERCRRHAGKIVQGIRQVDGIVKALLCFARPGHRRGRAATVSAIVAEAAAGAGLPAARLRLEGDVGLRAEADGLARVLANLFRNSLEAGGDGVSVRMRAAERDGALELTVADDGPGVDPELGSKVFEPFVSTKTRGHGLGLALAARVLDYLGGSLELLEPGEAGATFRVRVPLPVAEASG